MPHIARSCERQELSFGWYDDDRWCSVSEFKYIIVGELYILFVIIIIIIIIAQQLNDIIM